MRKLIFALVLVVAASLAVAAAAGATPGPIQVSGQSAGTSQQAVAGSSATQVDPSNTNIAIRVLSPGNDGDVTQSNTAASTGTAGNASTTGQSSSQTAGGSGIQTSQQSAGTDQLAIALSAASQVDPSNVNVPIRVLSPGNDGNVAQSNTAASTGTAGNTSTTGQSGSQTQAGSSCGCESSTQPVRSAVQPAQSSAAPIQTSDQSAGTHQSAGALSEADQIKPSNTNVSVRVLSPGDGGSVSQANTAASTATAGNAATTSQQGAQTAAGGSCGCGGSPVQQAKQTAETGQESGALSAAAQIHPSNVNSPVRVLSPGNDGSVDQSNTAASTATAGNTAGTTQGASQTAAGGSGIQIAGQDAKTAQGALAASGAFQLGASNNASPVRVSSPGNGGDVKQSNTAASNAQAGNAAGTTQNGTQTNAGKSCGCGGAGIQVLGQESATEQAAVGLSAAVQDFGKRSRCGCGGSGAGNTASPVRVYSPGDDGSVDQSNTAASVANAGNTAATRQDGSQTEAGSGLQIQALGQKALTSQASLAASLAAQFAPSNNASPVRVYSPGGGGSVSQANTAASQATGANNAGTSQDGRQTIAGASCGCASLPIQAAGQQAQTGQIVPAALSTALQALPSNGASPESVWSAGDYGRLGQSNTGASVGDARNRSESGQGVGQTA